MMRFRIMMPSKREGVNLCQEANGDIFLEVKSVKEDEELLDRFCARLIEMRKEHPHPTVSFSCLLNKTREVFRK